MEIVQVFAIGLFAGLLIEYGLNAWLTRRRQRRTCLACSTRVNLRELVCRECRRLGVSMGQRG